MPNLIETIKRNPEIVAGVTSLLIISAAGANYMLDTHQQDADVNRPKLAGSMIPTPTLEPTTKQRLIYIAPDINSSTEVISSLDKNLSSYLKPSEEDHFTIHQRLLIIDSQTLYSINFADPLKHIYDFPDKKTGTLLGTPGNRLTTGFFVANIDDKLNKAEIWAYLGKVENPELDGSPSLAFTHFGTIMRPGNVSSWTGSLSYLTSRDKVDPSRLFRGYYNQFFPEQPEK